MVNIILVQLLVLFSSLAWGKMDVIHQKAYLGEKDLKDYSERYHPVIRQNLYQGHLTFSDDQFFQNYFDNYLWDKQKDYSEYLKSELPTGLSCSDEKLNSHFDDIRFAYRLITLSYLLEGQWHYQLLSNHFGLNNACDFDMDKWLKSCDPQGKEMKRFLKQLTDFKPRYQETFPANYKIDDWKKELSTNKYQYFSQYQSSECKNGCDDKKISKSFNRVCERNAELMTLICSENDELLGLSQNRDAYFLLGQSNIINTFNQQGEALSCMRRFSEVFSPKEVNYPALKNLFPPIQSFLRSRHNERFIQGRVFFFGAGKEFEAKGLSNLYVKDQPFELTKKSPDTVMTKAPEKKTEKKVEVVKAPEVKEDPKEKNIVEIRTPLKSAFLQASELRSSQNLPRTEVDMLKLKYDYVFSLNMINNLSQKLKTFMTREALQEMSSFDKLGTPDGAVPLLFIKFMIDMEEHQGMWNLVSVLGPRFFVSNEIDNSFSPKPELIELVNNSQTGNQWQIFILKP